MENLFTDIYPYGTQYHRAPTPLPEEWEGDFKEISKNGYTHVQFRPQWRWHERIRGQYTWDDLDRLFDLAEQYNLKVVLKPMLENAPDYVFRELEGTRIGFRGHPIGPISHAAFYVGGWLPCFDNPEVAKAAGDFVFEMVSRYKDRKCLWFYNAWNEPRSRPLGQCTCKHSLKKYQDYLRRRFGTIENLNSIYGKAWESFETVTTPLSSSDYVELFLWRRWAAEAVSEHIAICADAIRRADPNAKVMCHVGASSARQDPACDTSDDFQNKSRVDWYGTSMWIPLNPENPNEYNSTFFQSAWLHRVDKNWMCHEFYPNQGNWWPEATPQYIEQAALMAISVGCRGLTFWQYRGERLGEESNGWGMRNIDGSATPRSERFDRLAGLLANERDLAKTDYVKPEVAVYFDIENDLQMRIQTIAAPTGEELGRIQPSYDHATKTSINGLHATLRRLGHTADFVVNGDDLSCYKAVVVSALEMTDEVERETFQKYVENGGVLYIEYPFACRDERTWVSPTRPNLNFDKLTGLREAHRVDFSKRMTDDIYFEDGRVEKTGGWHVTLEPVCNDVKVLARWEDGGVAIAERQVGKGKVIVSGGNFSIWANSHSSEAIPSIFAKVLEDAKIKIDTSPLWTTARESDEYLFRFLFNTGDGDIVVDLEGEIGFASVECTKKDGKVTLPPQTTVVLKIKK
ncbi:MAG: beta-galactosidase [Clostridia bacterium]|nr:beta-galactosidase [Clostridia bacterium]